MTLTHPNPKEKVERPAKAWRNRYVASKGGAVLGTRRFRVKAWKVYDSPFIWPTKDVAEQKHHERLAAVLAKHWLL